MKGIKIELSDKILNKLLITLEQDKLSLGEWLNNCIQQYINNKERELVRQKIKDKQIKIDSTIIECAIRYIEQNLNTFKKEENQELISEYSIMSEMFKELLKIIDTPKSQDLNLNFDYDESLEYIDKKLYEV